MVGQASVLCLCSFGILMWAMLAGREAECKTRQPQVPPPENPKPSLSCSNCLYPPHLPLGNTP